MKRLTTSVDSLGGLEGRETAGAMPISPSGIPQEEKGKYGERFQAINNLEGLEEGDCEEEELLSSGSGALGEKKRRLSVDQVKALEKNFEVENKLDPERKARLAQDLGLQPRQVAVWFQNRRARWKTKQLERDYAALRARYDALKLDCDALRRDREALLAEIRELKAKLATTSAVAADAENKGGEERPALIYKDGASDSDSSVVFNNEEQHYQMMGFKSYVDCSSSSPQLFDDRSQSQRGFLYEQEQQQQQQQRQQLVVGMDEVFLSGEEPCSSLFSEEQAPSLAWYCSERWE